MSLGKEEAIGYLMRAVESAQASARAWDVRAQIVGIGYIFSIGVIDSIDAELVSRDLPSHILNFTTLLLFMLPIIAFGYVLFPKYKLPGSNEDGIEEEFTVVSSQLFHRKAVDELAQIADELDWKRELVVELAHLSSIREVKRKRFVFALYLCCISYCFVIVDYIATLILTSAIFGSTS